MANRNSDQPAAMMLMQLQQYRFTFQRHRIDHQTATRFQPRHHQFSQINAQPTTNKDRIRAIKLRR